MEINSVVKNVEKIKELHVQLEALNKEIEEARIYPKIIVNKKEVEYSLMNKLVPIIGRHLREQRNNIVFELRKLGVTFPE